RDLRLFVRVAVPAINTLIPLENKFGIAGDAAARLLVKTRQAASELGITFHVGSQTTTPDAFTAALRAVGSLIGQAGVVVDRLDVGGGFPARYANSEPDGYADFIAAIDESVEELPVREDVRLMCEPGRALVAEAESVIVRVDARRDNALYINDGAYGTLFDAAHSGLVYPVTHVYCANGGATAGDRGRTSEFELWGPTCDSIDHMPGPFTLPDDVAEGDYLEIGNIGAYGRALAGKFNGYGTFDEAILLDRPFASMFAAAPSERSMRQAAD
ncbi:MAG: type III PLP-dependent enzyme, partial [Pseudomonadota bacterium]